MSKSLAKLLRDYISPIGIKIAVPTGALLFVATMINLYRQGGWEWVLKYSLDPFFWLVPAIMFVAFVLILSKVVILPLKRFELHVKELGTGEASGPFEHGAMDELGFLAGRFNALQKTVNDKIERRDRQLDVLHRFMGATSGVFDADALMANFFGTLATAASFDAGAYLLTRKGHVDGAIFSGPFALPDETAFEISAVVTRKAGELSTEVAALAPERLKSIKIDVGNRGGVTPGKGISSIEFPLRSFGETIGVVSIVNARQTAPAVDAAILEPMLSHLSMVLERVLTHVTSREETLEKILANMNDGVFLVDEAGRVTTWNASGSAMATAICRGCDGACNESSCEFHPMIERAKKSAELSSGGSLVEEIRGADGRVHQYSVARLDAGYVVTARDVTEDKLMQKKLLLSSKLSALGEMAAGIAHEVNNPLQVMMGNIEILESMQPANAPQKAMDRLLGLKDGVLRIKGIIRNLLVFAREQTTETEDLDVNHVISRACDMLRGQLKLSNVAIDLDLDPRQTKVKCNGGLLQQVIINLLQNARDAMEESGVGSRVYIRTNVLQSGEIVIEVTDDGPGIPKDLINRIFDPFFTTKDVGKGTGLGLSLSKRIVEGMGGSLDVSSENGGGASFHVTLMTSDAKGRPCVEPCAEPAYTGYPDLANKDVLLVDDEVSVASTVRTIISPYVASVETAEDGNEALELVKDRDFDILLLDIRMPGMDGMRLYRSIRDFKPYMTERIIFLTGDVENERTRAFLTLSNCRYLAKPFESGHLLRVMSREGEEIYHDNRA